MSLPVDPLIGMNIGPYLIRSLIGAGGMGRVYEAYHESLDRCVAIKLLMSNQERLSEEMLHKFREEARNASKCRHPNIITIYDFGVHDHTPYMVMELLRGESLADLMKRQKMINALELLEILSPIAQALSVLHDQGMIHRDIKPGNIFIERVNHTLQIKLLDFGLAFFQREGDLVSSVIGTPLYMAPEQVLRQPLSPRTDVFALAALSYYCLSGQRPVSGEGSPIEALIQRATNSAEIPKLSSFTELSEEVSVVIDRGMANRPEDRHASPIELVQDLCRAVRGVHPDLGSKSIVAPRPALIRLDSAALPNLLSVFDDNSSEYTSSASLRGGEATQELEVTLHHHTGSETLSAPQDPLELSRPPLDPLVVTPLGAEEADQVSPMPLSPTSRPSRRLSLSGVIFIAAICASLIGGGYLVYRAQPKEIQKRVVETHKQDHVPQQIKSSDDETLGNEPSSEHTIEITMEEVDHPKSAISNTRSKGQSAVTSLINSQPVKTLPQAKVQFLKSSSEITTGERKRKKPKVKSRRARGKRTQHPRRHRPSKQHKRMRSSTSKRTSSVQSKKVSTSPKASRGDVTLSSSSPSTKNSAAKSKKTQSVLKPSMNRRSSPLASQSTSSAVKVKPVTSSLPASPIEKRSRRSTSSNAQSSEEASPDVNKVDKKPDKKVDKKANKPSLNKRQDQKKDTEYVPLGF